MISNYALSELDINLIYNYKHTVLPLCYGGFYVWNSKVNVLDIFEHFSQLIIETERPLTYNGNSFIYVKK